MYVLTNEAHPQVQKIGFTTRSPMERVAELDTTKNPHPFVVSFALYHIPREKQSNVYMLLWRSIVYEVSVKSSNCR